MYAVIEVGGKQYRVEKGQSLVVDRLPQDVGAKVSVKPLLYRPEKGDPVYEVAELGKVKVDATVVEHLRGEKIRVFKYKPKKGYRRRAGHRSELTRIDIKEIKAGAVQKKESAAATASTKTAATKPATKKASEKKPGAAKSGTQTAKPKPKPASKSKSNADAKPKPKADRPATTEEEGK